MSNYDTLPGLDRARYEALLNNPIPHPLPQDAVLVIGADWCFDTQNSIMHSGYPTRTSDGRPILYLNDANPEAHRALGTLPGKEILGGGVDSPLPPTRPVRQYNYPTVVATRDGALTEILFADTVPPQKLTEPEALAMLHRQQATQHREAPLFDPAKAAPLFDNPLPRAFDIAAIMKFDTQAQFDAAAKIFDPNTVYAVVSSNCGHCHDLLARTDYPRATEDGRPIVYLNLASDSNGAPLNAQASMFYTIARDYHGMGIAGYPTFITTDANGTPSIAATGPSAIIEQFFPRVAQAEASQGKSATPPSLEERGAAPPPVLEEREAAPPPGMAANEIRDIGKALGASGILQTAPQVASGPALTPIERAAGESLVRNG